jgi:predicted HAD superfamily Cof-like phosphohydrolase
MKMTINITIEMSQSNFQKVGDFHEKFEHTINTEPQTDIFTTDPKLLSLRFALVEEEFNELAVAIKDHDFTEVVDALADMLYVLHGFGHTIGVDMDNAFSLVHDSNMSKLCKTEQDAIDTVEWYKSRSDKAGSSPQYRKTKDGKAWLVFDSISGKVLKSKYYTPVDLSVLTTRTSE